ncbi:MAG: hypothetical protein HOY71_21430 [Nonomuraea sp.]|nr:hypothetical protein [Nonomuraea sp.]NUS11604.1 hypothetical protein [Streptomyces sp.]
MNEIFKVVQPPVHTEPIGNPRIWDAAMNRSGGRCECTGSCGRTHSKTEFRCDRWHDRGRVRLLVAPADLALTPQQAAHLTLPDLRHWCPECYQMARRRHIASREAFARFDDRRNDAAPATLFDL